MPTPWIRLGRLLRVSHRTSHSSDWWAKKRCRAGFSRDLREPRDWISSDGWTSKSGDWKLPKIWASLPRLLSSWGIKAEARAGRSRIPIMARSRSCTGRTLFLISLPFQKTNHLFDTPEPKSGQLARARVSGRGVISKESAADSKKRDISPNFRKKTEKKGRAVRPALRIPTKEDLLLSADRTGAAGDAVSVVGVPDPAGIGRATGQVAVVVVRRQKNGVPVGGSAAVHHGGGVALAARDDAVGALAGGQALVPDGIHLLPAGRRAPAGDELLGEVPVGRAGDVALAVALVAHGALVGADEDELVVGAGVAVAVDAVVVRHGAGPGDRVAAAGGEGRHVAHARAGGVAVGAGDAGLEVLADAGVLGLDEGEGVAHRLAGALVGSGAARVGVHAMAPLVEEHGRDLTRVGAAAARTVEVHRRAVPEGVAGVVDVHVR